MKMRVSVFCIAGEYRPGVTLVSDTGKDIYTIFANKPPVKTQQEATSEAVEIGKRLEKSPIVEQVDWVN